MDDEERIRREERIANALIVAEMARDYETVANRTGNDDVRFMSAEIAEVCRRLERKILGGTHSERIDHTAKGSVKVWREKRPTRRARKQDDIIDATPPPPDPT